VEKRLQNRLFDCIRQVVSTLELRSETDRELLQRFVSQRDEAAFAVIVRRHGPMVLRGALRALPNAHDSEDVFQATFLVLSQKAHTLRRLESLGSWLYGIAYRLALKTKATAGERRNRERRVVATPVATPLAQITVQEAQCILDEEISRLPQRFREPVALCCLEGFARDEAARQIGCPASVLKSRLEQARKRLRQRLIARGLTLPCGLGAFLLLEGAAGATVPPALIVSTTKAAIAVAAGEAVSTVVTAKVAALTEGVLKTMLLAKFKIAALALVAAVVVGSLGTSKLMLRSAHGDEAATKTEKEKKSDSVPVASKQSPKDEDSKGDKDLAGLEGGWNLVSEDVDGKSTGSLMFKSYEWAFKGKEVTTAWERADDSIDPAKGGGTNKFVIDSTKNPKELTITGDNIKIQAVYKLEKDQLTIASFGPPERARPKGFTVADAASEGQILVVWVLKRAESAKAKPMKGDGKLDPNAKVEEPKKAADEPAWKKEFREKYGLKKGEHVKRIAPPYPSCRSDYLTYRLLGKIDKEKLDDYAIVLGWRDGWAVQDTVHVYVAGGIPIDRLLDLAAGIPATRIEGLEKLIAAKPTGDFVFRDGAKPDQIVTQLETILKRECGLSVSFQFKDAEREVFVLEGKYEAKPLDGRQNDEIEIYAKHLVDRRLGDGGTTGTFEEFLARLERHVSVPVLAGKIEGLPKNVRWHYNVREKGDANTRAEDTNAATVLDNIASQTGLTVKTEKQKVRVLVVIDPEKADK
jgi:RNA polymerase sigma factor (sigma-70 family)